VVFSAGLPRTIASIFGAVLGACAVAVVVRWGLVERDDLGAVCEAVTAPWWCELRMLVIQAFLNDVFGRASVVLAGVAFWRRSPVAAYLALALGSWGMVLYTFTWSGVGVLGGAMALARLQGQRQENGRAEQEAC
jgi:glycerol uptake facilitator-like aquaporin